MNNVFYDVARVADAGVDPARIDDPREFLEVLESVEGVVGMEQPKKNPSTVVQLITNVFVGQFSAPAFAELTREEPGTREDPGARGSEVREALELVDRFAAVASDDAPFLDMVDASDRFVDGESAFFHQGD